MENCTFQSATSNFYCLSDWKNGRDGGNGSGVGVKREKRKIDTCENDDFTSGLYGKNINLSS